MAIITSEKFYNTFSFLYPVIDVFLIGHKKLLANEANMLPAGTLLETGVGNGSHLKLYHNKTITAIDTSAGMLARAKANNPDGITFIKMDGTKLIFEDSSFDVVVLCHVLAVTEAPDAMLSETHRVLKSGGHLFILNHFTPHNLLGFFDRAFNGIAKLFKFRSEFRLDSLDLSQFRQVKTINCSRFSYFKLIVLQKP